MGIARKDLEDSFLKKIDFVSFKSDITQEIQNLKNSSEARDLRLERFIKEIDEDLTSLRIESNETRDHLEQVINETRDHFEQEINETRDHLEQVINETRDHFEQEINETRDHLEQEINEVKYVVITFSDEIRKLKSDLNRFKESFDSMKMFLIFFILLHFYMIYSSTRTHEKLF
jgi:ElaB/YqjD/DUF883 family membrane-anchored ribosome-binding protein